MKDENLKSIIHHNLMAIMKFLQVKWYINAKKYLFPAGEHFVETAYIPDRERATLCVSSQVGCKMDCLFCATGKQGFQKNLSPAEILNQIFSLPEFETLSNIVSWAWASLWTITTT